MLVNFGSKKSINWQRLKSNISKWSLLVIMLLNCVIGADLEFDYDEMTKALKDSEMIHSSGKTFGKSRPCVEVVDKGVTFIKAVSKKTKKLVSVSPLHKFDVAFCASESESKSKCAPESRCTTAYKWKPALTKLDSSGPPVYIQDEILVPESCFCFLGAEREDDPAPLIIL
uniref:Uncharacterized protein n=1 Tax=Panagrolaimus sp. JU765 TaxID=591449 RepID=A0AC34QHZ9_9BILA